MRPYGNARPALQRRTGTSELGWPLTVKSVAQGGAIRAGAALLAVPATALALELLPRLWGAVAALALAARALLGMGA